LLSLAGSLLVVCLVLGAAYATTLLRARQLDLQRGQLLADVGLLQTALLPAVPALVGSMRTSVSYRPSEGPGAGGDFYDALELSNGCAAFLLGDVCGHGRHALDRTAFVRFTLRAYLEAGLRPREALQVGGEVIDEHMGGSFATAVIAVHDPASGTLTYACAGHPAPVVVGPARPQAIFACSSPPLGLGLRTGLRQTTLPLAPGSTVCLYTDGLSEARTARGILGHSKLGDMVAQMGRGATASSMLAGVVAQARTVTDDMSAMVLHPTGDAPARAPRRVEELDVDAAELAAGVVARFLTACGMSADQVRLAESECREVMPRAGRAVLEVTYGAGGPVAVVASGSEPTRTSIFPTF
jgi:hypothetical protein